MLFWQKEAEARRLLAKMYQRPINAADCASVWIINGLEMAGVKLMLTRIGDVTLTWC